MTKRSTFSVAALAAIAFCAMPVASQAQAILGGQNLGDNTGGSHLDIYGQAPQACIISAPTSSALNNATLTAGATSADIEVTQLVNPSTAVPLASSASLSFHVTCNSAHEITVQATQGGLSLQGTQPTLGQGFRDHLDYTVSASWAGQQASGTSSSGTPVQFIYDNGASGELYLTIQIAAGGDPLVAGEYADSLIVNLTPQS